EYSTDLFSSSTISRLLDHYEGLLVSLLGSSELSLDELSLVSAEEEHLLLDDFNDTFVEYGLDQRISVLFEEQAALNPLSLAIEFEGLKMSYVELNKRSNQLAHYLRSEGVANNVLVGICHERGIEMIVGLLAIYKAGGAYVPLDPFYPSDRLAYMILDCSPHLILSSSSCSGILVGSGDTTIIELDTSVDLISTYPDHNPDHTTCEALGYVIYTSGSTGKPKGVSMPERGLLNLLFWHESLYGGRGYKVLQFASLNFDASFQEIFSALCFGGSIHLVSEDDRKDMSFLLNKIDGEGIEHLFIPYVVLKNLVDQCVEDDHYPSGIARIFTAGEQLRLSADLREFFNRTNALLLNYYGPSETHVVTWYEVVDEDYDLRPLPPIGKPISNTEVYILDKIGGLCAVGILGEIYLGGVQVANGYLNQALLSSEKFIEDRFKQDSYHRHLYKTGDIGRWLSDGTIEFLGRVDDQVKIRGNRVELGEVESGIESSGFVSQSVVMVNVDEHGYSYLVAYLVVESSYSEQGLLSYLRSILPDYMIPSFFVELADRLPLTNNGKVDKRLLPKFEKGSSLKGYVAPTTAIEESMVGIWSRLLGIEKVGVTDNFFEIGGHSLLATRLVSAIRKELSLNLSIRDIFVYPSIELLSGHLENNPTEVAAGSIMKRLDRPSRLPLSFSQERLWFIDQLEGSIQYHLPFVLRLQGSLDNAGLEFALRSIVARHEILRTVIRKDGDEVHQV
ncbi:MAG: amino acid adenylation domain-containing protein, partial [Bacteroidetes bacterium]|nr:amino acid adenylation domain-containing protein [Bacteroidota bacterium]